MKAKTTKTLPKHKEQEQDLEEEARQMLMEIIIGQLSAPQGHWYYPLFMERINNKSLTAIEFFDLMKRVINPKEHK